MITTFSEFDAGYLLKDGETLSKNNLNSASAKLKKEINLIDGTVKVLSGKLPDTWTSGEVYAQYSWVHYDGKDWTSTLDDNFNNTPGTTSFWVETLTPSFKSKIGLGNVDNTSDLLKPISTATQTALDLKAPLASPVFNGNVTGLGVATGTSFNAITGLATAVSPMNGVATVGTGVTVARQDHVHRTDTSRQATLISGTNIRTVNGNTLLGSTDIVTFSGATITNDTTTDASVYPLLSSSTSGSSTAVNTSDSKLYFNPSTGNLSATQFTSLSDSRLKTNVVTITTGLETVKTINPVEFTWIDNGLKSSGVIAQELELILPFLINTSVEGTKSVNYSGIISYLISAVQELSAEIEILKAK